ncbi:hypothetical protein N7528_002311 [Penicillium herquei]|nr:hypothetical protein N7528_002311 [Penicillium herquei]
MFYSGIANVIHWLMLPFDQENELLATAPIQAARFNSAETALTRSLREYRLPLTITRAFLKTEDAIKYPAVGGPDTELPQPSGQNHLQLTARAREKQPMHHIMEATQSLHKERHGNLPPCGVSIHVRS